MNEIPNCPAIKHCHCDPEGEKELNARGETRCVCGETEKALRAWINNRAAAPMTKEQREWCLEEIDGVEGYERKTYENDSDAELAMGVLNAWTDYCRDKGLM